MMMHTVEMSNLDSLALIKEIITFAMHEMQNTEGYECVGGQGNRAYFSEIVMTLVDKM